MKTALVICDNHMDITWRRCFEDHFRYKGTVVRPYAQIEGALFDSWIDIAGRSGCKYAVEQSMTVKEYLKRNPDKRERFQKLVSEGKIELLGGGETIIDYNMASGESIVRNHMYSILYYLREFGARPNVGCATDTFGLSAQMPQIFRKFGYDNLAIYSRVFQDAKPFWRGLNGDLIYIQSDYDEAPRVQCYDYRKYTPCLACLGEGCPACGGTGIDYSTRVGIDGGENLSGPAKTVEGCFEEMSRADAEFFMLQFFTEEAVESGRFPEILAEMSEKYGIAVEYVTHHEFMEKFGKPRLELLNAGAVPDGLVNDFTESKVISPGCYVTRSRIKQVNRELEDLLLSGEKFAVFARDYGLDYPGKKIGRLWNMMSFLQFHDAITATHTDAGFQELMTLARDIRLGAYQIYGEAARRIERHVTVDPKPGYRPFIIFNPLNWDYENNVFTACLTADLDEEIPGVEILDGCGKKADVLSFSETENKADKTLRVRFIGLSVPETGYAVFYWKALDAPPAALSDKTGDGYIENEFYTVRFDKKGIREIFDKELGEAIMTCGAADLVVEEDYGSPWETMARPDFSEALCRRPGATVAAFGGGAESRVVIQGSYTKTNRKIYKLDWTQTVTLYKGVRKVFITTDADWDTAQTRLKVMFPLGFKTPGDEAYYDVPYGVLKRPAYRPAYGTHSVANGDWPAINFMSAYNAEKDYCVTLLNRGLASNRLANGVMTLALMRSPEVPVFTFDFDGAHDRGPHRFEYAVASSKGGIAASRAAQEGAEFNTAPFSCGAECKQGSLPMRHSFIQNENKDIIITAVKQAEKGDDVIVRLYEPYGNPASDRITGLGGPGGTDFRETDFLETENAEADAIRLGAHEIKSYRYPSR
ncbi:MAG: glycosyl hydrolase-related protein [Firmicutes bacterium]|nr:glycosyl hydrolase-related protein [Bacillota bacterium]